MQLCEGRPADARERLEKEQQERLEKEQDGSGEPA